MSNHEPTESTQVDESGSSEPSGLDGAVLELCPVCGGSRRVTLRDDWQRGVEMGQAVPIVGCGNPWHYTNAEVRAASPKGERASAQAASPAPEVVEALQRLRDLHSNPVVIRPVDDDGAQYPPVEVCDTCGRKDVRWPCETLNRIEAAIAAYAEADREAGDA